jgi:hypothetical protein
MDLQQKTLPKLCQNHLKNCKMEFKKPLSEQQKRSLSNAITALNNPIFTMDVFMGLIYKFLGSKINDFLLSLLVKFPFY